MLLTSSGVLASPIYGIKGYDCYGYGCDYDWAYDCDYGWAYDCDYGWDCASDWVCASGYYI